MWLDWAAIVKSWCSMGAVWARTCSSRLTWRRRTLAQLRPWLTVLHFLVLSLMCDSFLESCKAVWRFPTDWSPLSLLTAIFQVKISTRRPLLGSPQIFCGMNAQFRNMTDNGYFSKKAVSFGSQVSVVQVCEIAFFIDTMSQFVSHNTVWNFLSQFPCFQDAKGHRFLFLFFWIVLMILSWH